MASTVILATIIGVTVTTVSLSVGLICGICATRERKRRTDRDG